MNEKFLKPYNPQETEDRIYKLWEKSGFFNPDNLPERHTKPFSIVLTPPNATGTLHIGGSLMTVIQDIIIRYKRMDGFKTLWIPGTDHAAIATNTKVEKILLKEEDKNRHDIGREAFVKKVEEFVETSRGIRVINWDPKGQTSVSDDEVVYRQEKGKLYTFKYSKDFPIAIATTRPE